MRPLFDGFVDVGEVSAETANRFDNTSPIRSVLNTLATCPKIYVKGEGEVRVL